MLKCWVLYFNQTEVSIFDKNGNYTERLFNIQNVQEFVICNVSHKNIVSAVLIFASTILHCVL